MSVAQPERIKASEVREIQEAAAALTAALVAWPHMSLRPIVNVDGLRVGVSFEGTK